MAQLKDLIVNGASRFIGKINANGGIALNENTKSETLNYVLGIKAFSDGGDVIWQPKDSVVVGKANALTTGRTLTIGNTGKSFDGSADVSWSLDEIGAVVGPTSATDNAIARFDGTTGKLIQDSSVTTLDDTGLLTTASVQITNGTKISATTGTVLGASKGLTMFNQQLFFEKGAVFGGTAQAAGLVTRGICGISAPEDSTGSCETSNLYINYDGLNSDDTEKDYNSNRQLVLQASSPGAHYGNNLYQYAAARGDAVKGWVEAQQYATQATVDGLLAANDAFMFKGILGVTVTALPASHSVGEVYKVGTAGSYAGQTCNIGDTIYCIADGTTDNAADWCVLESNQAGVILRSDVTKSVGSATTPVYVNASGMVTACSREIPSLTGYATEEYVDSKLTTTGAQAQRYVVQVSEVSSTVSFGTTFADTTHLTVYQNGILLAAGIHYNVNSDRAGITLVDYSTEVGDIFTFVNAEQESSSTVNEIVRGRTVATAGASEIAYPMSISSTDGLVVYENGVLIEEGSQYTTSSTGITLIDYTAKEGDVFTFISNSAIAGYQYTPSAASIILNSSKFTETSVQGALESLQTSISNLGNADYLPLSGGTLTGALTCNSTITATGNISTSGALTATGNITGNQLYMSNSSTTTSGSYIICDGGTNTNFRRVPQANFLTMFTGQTTTTTASAKSIRNIMYKTSAPTSSEGNNGDICIVYTA